MFTNSIDIDILNIMFRRATHTHIHIQPENLQKPFDLENVCTLLMKADK